MLELVEGPTLADRISKGPIPIDEALPIAKQIAEALEAAHEAGVIHRDLKPANIKVREDGTVKVLDFGLAKALSNDPSGHDLSQSPTITASLAGTREGVILGTAAYMSPEQARGRTLDARTDIWSFGCVLYEALTGHAAYLGETLSDTLAAVLEREPDWSALPPSTPARLKALLRRCLQKQTTHRLHHIGDARIEFDEGFSDDPNERSGAVARGHRGTMFGSTLPWTVAVVLAAVVVLLWMRNPRTQSDESRPHSDSLSVRTDHQPERPTAGDFAGRTPTGLHRA